MEYIIVNLRTKEVLDVGLDLTMAQQTCQGRNRDPDYPNIVIRKSQGEEVGDKYNERGR